MLTQQPPPPALSSENITSNLELHEHFEYIEQERGFNCWLRDVTWVENMPVVIQMFSQIQNDKLIICPFSESLLPIADLS